MKKNFFSKNEIFGIFKIWNFSIFFQKRPRTHQDEHFKYKHLCFSSYGLVARAFRTSKFIFLCSNEVFSILELHGTKRVGVKNSQLENAGWWNFVERIYFLNLEFDGHSSWFEESTNFVRILFYLKMFKL